MKKEDELARASTRGLINTVNQPTDRSETPRKDDLLDSIEPPLTLKTN
jgi:hypothetical protein